MLFRVEISREIESLALEMIHYNSVLWKNIFFSAESLKLPWSNYFRQKISHSDFRVLLKLLKYWSKNSTPAIYLIQGIIDHVKHIVGFVAQHTP